MTFLFGHLNERDYLLNLMSDFLAKTKHKSYGRSKSNSTSTATDGETEVKEI